MHADFCDPKRDCLELVFLSFEGRRQPTQYYQASWQVLASMRIFSAPKI